MTKHLRHPSGRRLRNQSQFAAQQFQSLQPLRLFGGDIAARFFHHEWRDQQRTVLGSSQRKQQLHSVAVAPGCTEQDVGIQGQTGGPLDELPELMARLSIRLRGRGSDEARFAARVAVLISKVVAGDPLTRGRAAIRLGYLQRMRSLTPEEGISFGKAVWSKRESDSTLPQDTSLLAHALFDIPGHDKDDLTRLFRSNVVEKALSGVVSPDPITEIVGATRARSGSSPRAEWNPANRPGRRPHASFMRRRRSPNGHFVMDSSRRFHTPTSAAAARS